MLAHGLDTTHVRPVSVKMAECAVENGSGHGKGRVSVITRQCGNAATGARITTFIPVSAEDASCAPNANSMENAEMVPQRRPIRAVAAASAAGRKVPHAALET